MLQYVAGSSCGASVDDPQYNSTLRVDPPQVEVESTVTVAYPDQPAPPASSDAPTSDGDDMAYLVDSPRAMFSEGGYGTLPDLPPGDCVMTSDGLSPGGGFAGATDQNEAGGGAGAYEIVCS